ncbi:MAG: CDP-alcohol phosphatidyltransferase family protein [Steroidobacteraceae bacterium]|nr:CDP-alcohol phosphatidyltransferase family protein [Nevskiaceae bacterium]MCP5339026.1 CDP-alcohol phosphatidyltransferase family protein [Nevskiaceae bacterium]MCP5359562.1 CDP-alcohol phosphatidyltransferase family protein [Nevskiaceae bacterium]MCP5473038.1 CDP-alcohol phosphatidyltransferase family protein [Nevskiaceae bacterium]
MLRHLPNLICVARIALVWPIVTALHAGRYGLTLMLFTVAAVSDGVDGFLAKRFNWQSELGKFLDPMADKLLLVAVFVTAAWSGIAPWWLAAAAIARDLVIAGGALIFRLWFGPLRGRPTILSKANTALQILFLVAAILHAGYGLPPREVVAALAIATLVSTIASGADYVRRFTRRVWSLPARGV